MSTSHLHAALGAIIVTIGFWLAIGGAPVELLAAVALSVAGFLVWQGTTLGRLWAWTSLLIGLDSLAWPVVTMARISRITQQPDDQQMGMILTAVVAGLFASVFWLSFGWGIFRWAKRQGMEEAEVEATNTTSPPNKSRNRR